MNISTARGENLDETIIADPNQKPYTRQERPKKEEKTSGGSVLNNSQLEDSVYYSSSPDVVF